MLPAPALSHKTGHPKPNLSHSLMGGPPGKSEFERFDNAVRQVLTVSKEELLKREHGEQDKKEREKKRRPKK
jgi:hypothetical protein